ncbi:DnaB-like helicase C-terminal domain-containing protein [Bacillus paranthracis]|uniref:DnaB-like helicase C-terminal domain-containing protein n=1 Tax=Bacillus paranthracis TaxID=2026186 RepID=UPI001D0D7D34|nr:DnaB-like helicase C-terminal domain-containing protein [Bacillus paranthracis]
MLLESQLLSKVLDEKNFHVTRKFNITERDFETNKDVYRFIKDYVKEYSETPDYRTVIAEFEDFNYMPEVHDTFAYLCKNLKSKSAKRMTAEVFAAEFNQNYKAMSGQALSEWLVETAANIAGVANASSNSGTNIAVNGQERKEWYNENKENRSNSFIPTPYESLTKWLSGGFEIGDYLLLLAFTNIGKTWIACHFGQTAWRNGFGVLHYSPELSKKQTVYRIETLDGHFNNVDLRRGQLENEQQYLKYLDQFNEDQETPYIVKTMEDLSEGLSVDVIEADLQANPNISFVIIDGFNLMKHGNHGGKVDRNAMTTTSRRLRQIFGKYNVVGIVVHHTSASSQREKTDEDDDGNYIVTPPELTDFSETQAVIQDAATVLTFDQKDGIGKLAVRKAREPKAKDNVVELNCNFNLGFINEPDICSNF